MTTRRAFTREALRSITAFALLDGLIAHRLLGASVRPIIEDWLKQLDQIGRDLKDGELKDIAFQEALEELYRTVPLKDLLATLDFDRIAEGVNYPAKGARSLPVEFTGVPGLPKSLVFGRQIFAMKEGRSVIPHGHDNMATGFIVLKGTCRGRHWDRVEDHDDYFILRPTIDGTFGPGAFSTISDHKDNVHWFTATSETAFIFNIHVVDYNPENPRRAGRVYMDPLGEPIAGGLVKAPKITFGEANRRYG